MIEMDGVTIERSGRTLLENVDLTLPKGTLTAILGPNGAGKSTLIKAISREWPPSSGRVLIDGEDVRTIPAPLLAQRRAVVPQNTALTFPLTALDVVMLGQTVPGFGLATNTRPALDALAEVGLEGFADRVCTQLSGGERQRVHIARALCQLRVSTLARDKSRLFILDEPTSCLDPAHQVLVLSLIRRQAECGWCAVVVLHDLNLASAWADSIVLMKDGRIYARGEPSIVLTEKVLAAVYDCRMCVNTLPESGEVFVLPHQTQIRTSRSGSQATGTPRSTVRHDRGSTLSQLNVGKV